ncbi:MAG: hypothetical protein QUV20_07640 [Oceanibaculum nanhaiense]|uniref:hypothetical protein n=1 Tax=Oceanibaculum nanhaiense TaxID=1909734 RepID=UPI0025A355D3|nr:hypothetical protein [Oceanibaculum nanhaiense]MDM7946191.1 hypothetical protein [Oceanibaculum nanhaiense]
MSNSIRKTPDTQATETKLAADNSVAPSHREPEVRDEVKRATEWVMRRYERTMKALAK